MRSRMLCTIVLAALSLAPIACKKSGEAKTSGTRIGLVTDVGGRGDQSFNDGALRGLETWAAGKRYTTRGYEALSPDELARAVPDDLKATTTAIAPLGVAPVVLQAKQQEDYEPNLQLLVDDGVQLSVAVGFMLENAVESAAKRNPGARFLLIDSPILDKSGKPYELPNVRSATFREQEGTFLVGALAGLVTKTGTVGFVGGMQIPLIRRFEAGFRAGVMSTNPEAGKSVLVAYTGSFDKVEAGKQVAQDMISKNADVLFHAAGSDGLGVIIAAKEAKRWAIGCDSDQHHVAPEAVIASFIKHVDYAVYTTIAELAAGKFQPGQVELGLKEGGVGYSPLGMEKLPNKDALIGQLEGLRKMIVEGQIKVPAIPEELASFKAPAR